MRRAILTSVLLVGAAAAANADEVYIGEPIAIEKDNPIGFSNCTMDWSPAAVTGDAQGPHSSANTARIAAQDEIGGLAVGELTNCDSSSHDGRVIRLDTNFNNTETYIDVRNLIVDGVGTISGHSYNLELTVEPPCGETLGELVVGHLVGNGPWDIAGCEYALEWQLGEVAGVLSNVARGTGQPYDGGSGDPGLEPGENCILGDGRELCIDSLDAPSETAAGTYGETEWSTGAGPAPGCIEGVDETVCISDDETFGEDAPEGASDDLVLLPGPEGPRVFGGWAHGEGDGDGDGDGDGSGDGDGFDGEVTVDESGTPSGSDTMFDGYLDGSGMGDLQDGLDAVEDHMHGFTEEDFLGSDELPLPVGGPCQTMTIHFFGEARQFPSPAGCDALEWFKTLFGWLLAAYTMWAIFGIWTRT